jgi:hypothetical protein
LHTNRLGYDFDFEKQLKAPNHETKLRMIEELSLMKNESAELLIAELKKELNLS